MFVYQTNLRAAAQPKKVHNGVQQIPYNNKVNFKPIDASKLKLNNMLEHRATSGVEFAPLAIPPGIPENNVSFFGIDLTSSITADADTNGDRVPDPDATESFIASDDPDNEATSAFTFSSKTGFYYTGVIAAGGSNKQMGSVIVAQNNPTGTYKGIKKTQFSTGKGTPVGLAVQSTDKGDILYVASVFFANKLLGAGPADTFSITAYLPGADGFPDGTQKKTILGTGSKLGNDPINFSFGGLALDSNNNLYANALTIKMGMSGPSVTGAVILEFTDSDGDGIPDKGTVFGAPSMTDLTEATASSIVAEPGPMGGVRLVLFSFGLFQGQDSTIAFVDDANGDGQQDGDASIFLTLPPNFDFNIGSFGDGSSGIEESHMAFAQGEALYSYIALNSAGDTIIDSGVALTKDDGTGKGTAPVRVFQAPKAGTNFGGVTAVFNVPTTPDTEAPMVKVNSPNGGETVMGGTTLQISFTSTDNNGVVSHDINLSTDGGSTFPVVVASGLPGSAQSFSYTVPVTIDTTMARVEVIAKDAAGNKGMDSSDANFTIMKPTNADTQPPVVTITSPKSGDTLNGGSNATVQFTSTDNVGVASHNILFSPDGVNFTNTLASGLPGTATSFTFKVPSVTSMTAAIMVEALDASGNKGTATVGQLNVVTDTEAPKVTVTAPAAKAKLKGGQMFTVQFTATDNVGVASSSILLSMDGGATFPTTLATGVPGNATSFAVTIPNAKIKQGVIRVVSMDAAGNMGMGNSGTFKVKPSK